MRGRVSCEYCAGLGERMCPACDGSGITDPDDYHHARCARCRGRGWWRCPKCRGGWADCPTCGGTGHVGEGEAPPDTKKPDVW